MYTQSMCPVTGMCFMQTMLMHGVIYNFFVVFNCCLVFIHLSHHLIQCILHFLINRKIIRTALASYGFLNSNHASICCYPICLSSRITSNSKIFLHHHFVWYFTLTIFNQNRIIFSICRKYRYLNQSIPFCWQGKLCLHILSRISN